MRVTNMADAVAAPSAAPSTGAAQAAAPDRDWSPLLARLRGAPASGLVLVDARVKLAPSAEAARSAVPAGGARTAEGTWAATVIADEGDVVAVSTHIDRGAPFGEADRLFTLHGWIDKRSLVPMLRAPIARTFADQSGYWLEVGLPLRLADRARPLSPLLAPLDVAIADDAIALSGPVTSEEAPLPRLDGTTLGCAREWLGSGFDAKEKTRVAPASELDAEDAAKEAAAGGGRPPMFGGIGLRGYAHPCAPRVPVAVGGAKLGRGVDTCGSYDAIEAGGAVVATISVSRARVRGVVPKAELVAGGGCGAGRIGPRKTPVVVVPGKADVVYPDGTPAGTVRARTGISKVIRLTKIEGPAGLLCVKRSVAAAAVCFRAGEASEAIDLPFDDE